jgi:hypothetical protein
MEFCVVLLLIPVIEFGTRVGNDNYAIVIGNGLVQNCTMEW